LESKRTPGSLWIAIALVLATAAAYWPVLSNGFVNYDDDLYILNNVHVQRGLGADTLRWAFTTFRGANWFPLTWLSWAADFRLYGEDPAGFHLTSLLLHIANTLLLYFAFARLTGARWCSALVAALFALHPLHVESVAWAAARKDVLSGFFAMLTLLAYERFVRRPAPLAYAAVAVCLGLGLMAKPTLVTWPFVLLLLDAWPLARLGEGSEPMRSRLAGVRRAVVEKLPLLALVGVISGVAIASQSSWGTVQALERLPFSLRLANAVTAYAAYLADAFWPVGLAVFYPHPGDALTAAQVSGAAALLACVTAVAFALRRRHPEVAVGWLWFVGMLVPVIGLVQVGQAARADRYSYLPLIGLSLPIVWAVARFGSRGRAARALAVGGVLVVLLALGVATHRQVERWRDSRSLFDHALAVTKRNHVAHINLGVSFANAGEIEPAAKHLVRALQLAPASATAAGMLAEVRLEQGRGDEALRLFRRAIEIEPKTRRWQEGIANALLDLEQPERAIEHYRAAIAQSPGAARVHYNLGLALIRMESWQEAIASFRRALELDPLLAEAHGNLGVALLEKGDGDGAIAAFDQALALAPDLALIQAHAGKLRASRGELDRALLHLSTAARLAPDDAKISAAYARALAQAGRAPEAAAEYRRGLALGRRSLPALVGLAELSLAAGDAGAAVTLAKEAAVATRREVPAVLALLGEAYAAAGRLPDAVRVTDEAAALALARGSLGVHESLARRAKVYRAALDP
jgi:tetratricopeptide (TPR) repeat protein